MVNRYRADPQPVRNNTQTAEVNLPQDFQDYSEFLPNVNRTESIQRFFGSTVNQLLSSGSTQSIDTYWGRLTGRNYNPDNILFEPEDDATRLNYQFQPGIVRKQNGDTSETVSYINWLDRLESLGADLENHDRLFSEPGYTLDLPVNADMMINYYNYYWLEGNIPLVVIEPTVTDPIDIDDITKVSQYTTPVLGNYKTVEFVTGLRVQFIGPYVSSTSGDYHADAIYYVENVGGAGGIKLVEIVDENGRDVFPIVTPYYIEFPEGWDTVDWDTTPWDGTGTFEEYSIETTNTRDDLTLNKSYIVMERWARDKNPWARSNRWFSEHAIRVATEFNELETRAYLNKRTRAERPIIEYRANMELYNTCKTFVETVDFVITLDQVSEILGGNANYLVDPLHALQDGDIVLVVEGQIDASETGPYSAAFSKAFNLGSDASIINSAFEVGGVGTSITLTPHNTYNSDEYIIISQGEARGEIWCFDGTDWSLAQTKNERGQHPLFKLYDDEKTDLETYNDNDFAGEKIFGYEINPAGAFDRVLGFSPAFTNQGSFSNYRFEWTLNNTRYNQKITEEGEEEIRGYYFWRDWVRDNYYNGWSNIRGGQRVPIVQTTVADGVTAPTFELGTTGIDYPTEYSVSLVDGKYRWYSHSYMDRVSIGYENPEFIWKYNTTYTVNDLISESANKLEFVDPFGNSDSNITVNVVSDVLVTVNINSGYGYSTVHYRDQADPTNYGEIHLSDENQNRVTVQRNGQILDEGDDYTISGTTLTVDVECENNDVIELMYVADSDLENVVYDVAPVHFYNSENRPFTGAGYDDFINHFRRQLNSMPGFTGDVQGSNNYHRTLRQHTYDGLIRQQIYRTSHIQYLLDQENINPIRALKTNARDYSEFKRFFRNKVKQLWEKEDWDSIRELVDRAINDINLGKGEDFKYAHSDMAYSKQFNSLIYSINTAGETTFELPHVINKYGDTQNHVQVWLSEYDVSVNDYRERPLQKGVDYNIDGLDLVLTSPAAVKPADVVSSGVPVVYNNEQVVTSTVIEGSATLTIRWYDYTHLSHIPYSAVKLGFFKPTQVEVVDGELVGHDGSRHKLVSSNITDMEGPDFDVVSAALWDYELRVFNNLVDRHFVGSDMGSDMRDFYPNPVSEFAYDISDMTVRLDDWYNRYALRENIDEIDVIDYDGTDEFTWNYSSIIPGIGSWRSLYVYTFGTDRPHTHPWEMLGHYVKPTWWDANYSWNAGPLRDALLNALKYGITGNASGPDHIDIRYARSSYDWDNEVLVTDDGSATLNPPVTAGVVSLPANVDAARDFVFGDWSETENVWRKSSEYLFALAEVYLQLKPYRVFETFWSLDRWNINTGVTQEQWVNPDTCMRQDNKEIHNQLITNGVIGNIRVILGGTGYTSLDLDFEQDVSCSENASATAYISSGGVVAVGIENPGRGFLREPEVVLNANAGAGDDVELEYVVDQNYVVTHLGFNTLSAEEFRVEERYTNDLAERLNGLKYEYCVHVGGYTDKRILALELAGDHDDGQIRIPESSYDIVIDRNAPNTIVFYSGVRIQKIEGRGYLVDGYNLDSRYFNFLRPSTGGSQTTVQIGDVEVTKHLNWRNEVSRVPYRTIFRKRQELYQFLLGLGKYYESIGFDAFTEWEIDARAAIVWSLSDETEDLFVNGMSDNLIYNQGGRGVVQTVDVNYDGVLNVLDEQYQAIRRNELFVLRNEETTEIAPKSSDRRIYGLGLRVVEFEHIITLDNITTFNDPIYQPELGLGQNRIRLVGERTRNWNGRVEAPGYIIRNTGLVTNFETSVRELERDWISSESKALERLTRQTIGYNVGYIKPTYMTNTFIGDVSAYRFEKGERKYQGTAEAIAAMARNKNIFGSEFNHEFYEEWMVRLGDYGDISEREPLQFEVNRNKIKGDPQHFRFNENFVSDREDDLIIDINARGAEAINGNYNSPFDTLPVLRLNDSSIESFDRYQEFTRDAGLPLTTEIDEFLLSIDNISDIYNPTADYATIPNWNSLTAYVQGDRVRYLGNVWELAIGATGLNRTSNDLSFRATQVYPVVPSGSTFIANDEVVTFDKTTEVVTNNLINVDGTQPLPSVPSGSTLVLDGTNVNFIKTATTTSYADIVLTGSVSNPTITNSAIRRFSIFYADSASEALTEVTVDFDELLPTLTMQEIWLDALTIAGADSPLASSTSRVTALQALQSAYVSANSASAWETFIGNYYITSTSPDRILNPEYLGTQVNANPGASWEIAARDLIQLDLDLIEDLSGNPSTETVSSIVSGTLNNAAQFALDRDAANNLLDFFITNNDENRNLQDFITYVKNNGGTNIAPSLSITVTNPNRYVVDTLASIKSKIDSALIAAGAPGTISTSTIGNVLTITRSNNQAGYRLGVSVDTDLGFTASSADVVTTGTTVTGDVPLNLDEVVETINNAGIAGVSAIARNNVLRITSTNSVLNIGSSTANSPLGIGAGSYQASQTVETRVTDLNINDVVSQINNANIPDLSATQIEGVLIINYTGDRLEIGPGTANDELGITETVFDSRNDTVSNFFDPEDWNIVDDPLNLNVWVIDNIGSEPGASGLVSNRYDVYQTLDFEMGILEICAGSESGDDALVKLEATSLDQSDIRHNLEVGDFVFIINSSCVPSVDGVHRVTRVDDQQNFYIDRYIEERGFTGKVFPLRSVRFTTTAEAVSALEDPRYFRTDLPNGSGGLRNGDYVYVDQYIEDVTNVADEGEDYGAVYQVSVSDNKASLNLVRLETGKTNNSQIKNGVLHDNASGDTIVKYEVYDPLKGIIPGIADREIDIKSEFDSAYYNNTTDPEAEVNLANFWGQDQVGTVWWDLTTAIYLNYDQGSPEYRQQHWGQLFPGAVIDVYEWTKSPVTPDQYLNIVSQDTTVDGQLLTGVPYAQIDQYGELQYYWSEEDEINPITGQIETYFYFWVRGKTTVPNVDRQFSVLQLEEIILDPARQQIDWLAATSENTLLVSSLDTTTGYPELVMTVNYDANPSDYHQEYLLLAENDPSTIINEWLHISLRDSLAGYTQATGVYPWSQWAPSETYLPGQVVRAGSGVFFRCHTEATGINPDTDPDNDFWTQLEDVQLDPEGEIETLDYVEIKEPQNIPDLTLHPFVRQGIQVRPHQIWFENIAGGRRAIVEKLNSQLIEINLLSSDIPWRESFERNVNLGNGLVYDLRNYWEFADWSVSDYEYDRSVGNFFVEEVSELSELDPVEGNLAHVEVSSDYDGRNRREVYRYNSGEWQLVFKEKATIQFNDLLWDSELLQGGWDIADWDTTEWDRSSGGLMVEIFDELYYNIWVEERQPLYTDLWFAAVKYVLREQGEPDWIFKTSYFKVIVEDELEKHYNKYFTERVEDLIEYIETVKPFRSKLRDAIVRKTADEDAEIITEDTVEIRIQTNELLVANNNFSGGFSTGFAGGEEAQELGQEIVDPFTRAFRLNVGRYGNNYSSKIINDRKALLGMNIGPDDLIIPVLTIGDGALPDPTVTGETEAVWINGERIEYTSLGQVNSSVLSSAFGSGFTSGFGAGAPTGLFSGFTSGYDEGFSGVVLLTGVTRGTQGTFARAHSYADIMEGVGTDAELIENTTLSDWDNDIYPAWQPLGSGLLDDTNNTPNGEHMRGIDKILNITNISQANPAVVTVTDTSNLEDDMVIGIQNVEGMTQMNDRAYTITVIDGTTFSLNDIDSTGYDAYTSGGTVDYGACFGTIEPWGNILWAQIVALGQTADAIFQFQNELEELIEEYWVENYPWPTSDSEEYTADSTWLTADGDLELP